MSRKVWNLIKQSKRFHVRFYRKIGTTLLISVILNIFLGVGICYFYLRLPEPDFYSTYGETPPVLLTAMDEPNYSSTPLLSSDSSQDSDVRTAVQ